MRPFSCCLCLLAAVLPFPLTVFAFQHGVLYTFKTQPALSEPGRPDTGWYFAAQKTGGVYPRTATIMREGGFSDLTLDPSDATGHTFWAVQDRGMAVSYDGGSGDTAYKIFAFPGHHQKLVRLRVQGDSVEILSRDSIAGLDSGFVTGLPSTRVATEEAAVRMRLDSAVVDMSGARRVPASANGYDFEGLARTADGTFYLADEMGPRLVRVETTGAQVGITREWSPGHGLPRVLARRRDNRGLESLCATPSGRIAGLMQSGLANTASGKRSHAKDSTRVLRFLMLDPATDAVREHVYLSDLKRGTRAPSEVKIGAMTCLTDTTFLVIEHGEDDAGYDWIDLYRVDITAATSDVHEANDVAGYGRLFQGGLKTLEQTGYIPRDSATLVASGVTPLRKRLLFGDVMGRTAWRHDTPEGIAFVNDSTVALINDNDYGQKDEDGDGIPHLVGATRRLTQLMYLDLGPGFATALHASGEGRNGKGGMNTGFREGHGGGFRIVSLPGAWRVTGPRGLPVTARVTDARGRTVPTSTWRTTPSSGTEEPALHIAIPPTPGVYLLELNTGARGFRDPRDVREIRRVYAP